MPDIIGQILQRLDALEAAVNGRASEHFDRKLFKAEVALREGVRAGPGCLNRISASISGASAGLGCQAEGQRGEVGLIGCRAVKARMWAPAVVEVEVAAVADSRHCHG